MIEFTEAVVLAEQLNDSLTGKKIVNVIAAYSPHKFAWYAGDPQNYKSLLTEKRITGARSFGGFVEISIEDVAIVLNDGVNIRLLDSSDKLPQKHQLLIEFDDNTFLVCSVQMYGGMCAFKNGEYDNKYYLIAKEKPAILSDEFNFQYFRNILDSCPGKLSLKAFLATEQRFPGLGNGILQDILFNAGLHPKKKLDSLNDEDITCIYDSIKTTISEIISAGGRDTETNIYNIHGGYKTKLSKNTCSKPCEICGNDIKKDTYLGGSIYYCSTCQKL